MKIPQFTEAILLGTPSPGRVVSAKLSSEISMPLWWPGPVPANLNAEEEYGKKATPMLPG